MVLSEFHFLVRNHVGRESELSMLRPVSAVVPGNIPVASGDLDLVVPARGTLNCQSITDIYADMTFHPDGLTDLDLRKDCSYILADFNHTVCSDVRYTVASVGGTAVDGVLVAGPAPEYAFDETDAVKTEGIGRGSVDHGGSGGLPNINLSGLKRKKYRCNKRLRYTDVNGKTNGGDSKWSWTIEECEEEARQTIKNASWFALQHYTRFGSNHTLINME